MRMYCGIHWKKEGGGGRDVETVERRERGETPGGGGEF